MRERQGEKELLILTIKKEIYHFTLVWRGCTFRYMGDRCSAERMMEVTVAPRLY